MGLFDFIHKKQPIALPATDIHNHLLPGVDDGFRQADDSLRAIDRMRQNGVREFVFTPHMNPDVYPGESEAHFREVYASFAPTIPAEWGVTTHLAAEYMVVKDFEKRVSEHADELLCRDDKSILIEMSYYFRSRNFEDAIFELTMAGFQPIVAHPERYLYMADCLADYDRWIDMGCRLQMNLMSLTGMYGPASVKILKHLASHGMYSFRATDLHSLRQLDSILSARVADPAK